METGLDGAESVFPDRGEPYFCAWMAEQGLPPHANDAVVIAAMSKFLEATGGVSIQQVNSPRPGANFILSQVAA